VLGRHVTFAVEMAVMAFGRWFFAGSRYCILDVAVDQTSGLQGAVLWRGGTRNAGWAGVMRPLATVTVATCLLL